jgi:hypothetical protein
MQLLVHEPAGVYGPDGWDANQRSRLTEVVSRAISRAVATVRSDDVQIRLIPAHGLTSPSSSLGPTAAAATPSAPMRTPPGQGQPTAVPEFGIALEPAPMDEGPLGMAAEPPLVHEGPLGVANEPLAFTDRVIPDAFPRTTVLTTATSDLLAGGSPYVITGHLASAVDWGTRLFAAFGYAVFVSEASLAGPFYVASLIVPLQIAELEALDGAGANRIQATLLSPAGFVAVTVVTSEGFALLRPQASGTFWDEDTFYAALGRIPAIRTSDQQSNVVVGDTDLSSGVLFDETISGFWIDADEALYAALPREARAHFLALLIRGGIDQRRRTAVVKLIRAARSESELEALFTTLRQRNSYQILFRSVDRELVGMLRHLGQFHRAQPADWRILSSLINKSGFTRAEPLGDPLAGRADIGVFSAWLTRVWETDDAALFPAGADRNRLEYVSVLVSAVEQAQAGDPAAAQSLNWLIYDVAGPLLQAIDGARYANELGRSQVDTASQESASDQVISRLQAALIIEVLSWLAGIDATVPALGGVGLNGRIALAVRRSNPEQAVGRPFESLNDVVEETERLTRALATRAGLNDEARLVRVVELLPPRYLAQLRRQASLASLPNAVEPADIGYAIEMAGRLEARLGASDPLTSDLAVGLDALMGYATLGRGDVTLVIDGIPPGRLGEYMHTLKFIRSEHLATWGPDWLIELAQHPRTMALIREAGSDVALAVWSQLQQWTELEQFAGRLDAARQQSENAARFQELLVRIARGEVSAFQQVNRASADGKDVD